MGLPDFMVPQLGWEAIQALLPAAFVVAVISFMEAMSSCKVIAAKTRTPWSENQELIGQGLAKISAAFFQSMPVSGSFSRSALNLNCGARSGLSSLCAAAAVMLTLLFFTPYLYHLPQPVLAAMIMLRIALSEDSLRALEADAQRRTLIRLSLSLVPFAGIAFLWFIGVIREQLGEVEDRLFSTVFMGSGLLFLAMLFVGATTSASLLAMFAQANLNADVFAYGRDVSQRLFSVYAMRMAAVFTISVSTVGIRTSGLPQWVSYLGYLIALVLLVAAANQRWTQLVFPAWVLLVSVVILVVRPPDRPRAVEVGPDAAPEI